LAWVQDEGKTSSVDLSVIDLAVELSVCDRCRCSGWLQEDVVVASELKKVGLMLTRREERRLAKTPQRETQHTQG
jgi:hypothetical protein